MLGSKPVHTNEALDNRLLRFVAETSRIGAEIYKQILFLIFGRSESYDEVAQFDASFVTFKVMIYFILFSFLGSVVVLGRTLSSGWIGKNHGSIIAKSQLGCDHFLFIFTYRCRNNR